MAPIVRHHMVHVNEIPSALSQCMARIMDRLFQRASMVCDYKKTEGDSVDCLGLRYDV